MRNKRQSKQSHDLEHFGQAAGELLALKHFVFTYTPEELAELSAGGVDVAKLTARREKYRKLSTERASFPLVANGKLRSDSCDVTLEEWMTQRTLATPVIIENLPVETQVPFIPVYGCETKPAMLGQAVPVLIMAHRKD